MEVITKQNLSDFTEKLLENDKALNDEVKQKIDGIKIFPDQISKTTSEKVTFTGSVGNFYNSGRIIKTSPNSGFKKCEIDISGMNSGVVVFKYDRTGCYMSNTATVDGSENFIVNLYDETTETTWKNNFGLELLDNNIAKINIETLKSKKPEAKGLFVSCAVSNWEDPYIYSSTTTSFEWLKVTKENLEEDVVFKLDYLSSLIDEGKFSIKKEPVIFWGDSLTHGATDSYNNSYPKQLSDMTGLTFKNYGVSGEDVPTIMGRQGSQPFIVSPFTIPADTTQVEVTIKGNQGATVSPLKVSPTADKGINPCTINGVEGTLSRTGDTFYFTRAEAGSSVEVKRPVPIITYASKNYKDNPFVIWMGQNGGYNNNDEELVEAFKLATEFSSSDKFLLMCGFDGTGDYRENSEKLMTRAFGRKFVNVREYLVNYGLDDLGISPTSDDTTNISNGQVPSSLRTDQTHLTTDAYGLVAKLLYERGKELGYWL